MSRRTLLASAGAAGAAAALAACAPAAAPAPAGGLTLRWFGNNAWELTAGEVTVLVDPWLTRFRTGAYTPAGADPATPITVDTALLDRYVTKADAIVVTHGHYDHLPDVPHIAARTGATVFGNETHCNLLRALDAPAEQLNQVRGGERVDYGSYRIDVVPSVHSMTGPRARVPFPGSRPGAVPPRPRTIADLVEGGTLGYEITLGGRSVLALGGANYLERELAGRRPDAVLLPVGGGSVPDYVPRLLDLLGHPATVLPTHWDNFDEPLERPAVDTGGLDKLRAAVAKASPAARFVALDHLQRHTL
ncbi:MBL fold metallo-hydrolase [Pseudonocardia acaciae]|uniref:MBL fold metallo-hydrolase n=1 Tax=Pseudonocardia acaciae TaxID=551276 RepID=UPI00048C231D|nr:MBL fold metallo-hydrolase [Pseudonocardia acaciae]